MAPYDVEEKALAHFTALRITGDTTFVYRGRFNIDADGSPHAYHPGYTCSPTDGKGWASKTGIDCSSRSSGECHTKGFKDSPAAGDKGTMVKCTLESSGCTETVIGEKTQGACTMDSSAYSDGLDYLANAGEPGNFYAIMTKASGEPYVQSGTDPAPGFYISATALGNPKVASETDPLHWVDSEKVNYIALPPAAMNDFGCKKGDYVVAINWKTGTKAGAIFADVGSDTDTDGIGEGSIALAKAIGVPGTPKGGGATQDIVYVVFPGTTDGFPEDPSTVDSTATAKYDAWGGDTKLMQMIPKIWADKYMK